MDRSRSRSIEALARCAALALALLSPGAVAQNYSVNINPTLNGLDIKFNPQANRGMLLIGLKNNSDKKARCDFNYNAQPQMPHRTSVFIAAGKDATSSFEANTQWFSVEVDVTCIAVQD